MSKIDELIAELCPEGVRCSPLSKLILLQRGERVTKNDLLSDGPVPVVSGGKGYMGFVGRSNREMNTITIAQYGAAGYVAWQKQAFWANDVCFSAVLTTDLLQYRFLYHFLKSRQEVLYSISNRVAVPHSIDAKRLLSITIPLPPLEVQSEIVAILDKFTQLEAELEAELEARKSQYEHTRDQLLDFSGDLGSHPLCELIAEFCPEGVARIQIGGAVKKLRTGLNPRQNFNLNSPDATGYYVTVRELGGFEIRITEKTDKVSSDALEVIQKRSELQVGDVLFSGTGTIGRTALVSAAPLDWNIKEGVYALTPNAQVLDSRYFIYLLSSFNIRLHILSKSSGSTVGSIPFSELVKIEIPIPPLQVQREIVSILDKLDALVNDLTFGLPAEITARRKQYEYYRNKLLTFKELEAA